MKWEENKTGDVDLFGSCSGVTAPITLRSHGTVQCFHSVHTELTDKANFNYSLRF